MKCQWWHLILHLRIILRKGGHKIPDTRKSHTLKRSNGPVSSKTGYSFRGISSALSLVSLTDSELDIAESEAWASWLALSALFLCLDAFFFSFFLRFLSCWRVTKDGTTSLSTTSPSATPSSRTAMLICQKQWIRNHSTNGNKRDKLLK